VTSRQALHELIDSLDDEFVNDLLERVEDELALGQVPLSREALASIVRGIEESAAGKGLAHDEAMQSVGLDP
jgi:hypothetical protein